MLHASRKVMLRSGNTSPIVTRTGKPALHDTNTYIISRLPSLRQFSTVFGCNQVFIVIRILSPSNIEEWICIIRLCIAHYKITLWQLEFPYVGITARNIEENDQVQLTRPILQESAASCFWYLSATIRFVWWHRSTAWLVAYYHRSHRKSWLL